METGRAAYGKRLLPQLGQALGQEFGKGFDERNQRHMRAFFQCFPIWNAVRSELSWTHYRVLTRVESEEARLWYMQEAAAQNWSSRALERQIGSLYYERLLLSQDKAAVAAEARDNLATLELGKCPRRSIGSRRETPWRKHARSPGSWITGSPTSRPMEYPKRASKNSPGTSTAPSCRSSVWP
ncbi:MAG: hypothetical protein HYU78_17490 [Rhodocyclales bacterium]|nr:hypothetical protein [Rhodocyclales bacterium]